MEERAKRYLDEVKKEYGYVPVTNQVLSCRPDIFVPSFDFGKSVFEGKSSFDPKMRHLLGLAAAAALGGEYCMKAQMKDAKDLGATEDEVIEVLEIAAYMCMTRSQSYSFREFAEQYGKEIKEIRDQ
ncbi:putative gamma-carboxymuconolactone decarboxylase subunit -like protein [Thermoplasmatales archaeon BRNA1]|nr:putative gamma-carboxymuconolactone decarboxylase subunit -like protein [Thermoplasmatales archaeon BRNA1]